MTNRSNCQVSLYALISWNFDPFRTLHKVTRKSSECWVRCGKGFVSSGDWAQCVRDKSGWVARWSRVLLRCIPTCQHTVPHIENGVVQCTSEGKWRLSCILRCNPGHSSSLYNQPSNTDEQSFSCNRGIWIGVPTCVYGFT